MKSPSIPDHLEQHAYPELAAALQGRIRQILRIWTDEICKVIPPLKDLCFDEIIDHLPTILPQIAAVLRTDDPAETRRLLDFSPAQGMARFHQRYNIRELLQEDRLLRKIVIEQTTDALGRTMTPPEQVALNLALDLMLQQSVITFTDEQQAQLDAAAETELKHLSFLSHDLKNNLNAVTLSLQLLREELTASPQFADSVEMLDMARQTIADTMGGMSRLLQSEQLKRPDIQHKPVDLHKLATNLCHRHADEAETKGLHLAVEVPSDLVIDSDAELLTLVLQNLIGNAVKYSQSGTIRVTGRRTENDGCELSIVDEGPGIAPDQVNHLFETFRRGETHDQEGVGLGLHIASRAARLLGGSLTVNSTLGAGSTFTLRLPPHSV